MSIRFQLIGAALLVSLLVSVLAFVYISGQSRAREYERYQANIAETNRLLKVVTADPLYDGNLEQLENIIESFFSNPEILSISLREYGGDIRLDRDRSADSPPGEISSSNLVISRGVDELGAIQLRYTTALIDQRMASARNQFLLFSLMLMLGLVMVIYLVVRGLTKPIERLSQVAEEMAGGNLNLVIGSGGALELRTLAVSFTRMRDAIREKMGALSEKNRELEQEIAERQRFKLALEESETKYRTLFQGTVLPNMLVRGLNILDCNLAAAKLFGYSSREELIARELLALSPEYQPEGVLSIQLAQQLTLGVLNEGSKRFEWTHLRADGQEFIAEVIAVSVPLEGGQVFHVTLRDITGQKQAEAEKERLEEQLLRAQKMEAVGRLAGGVAHDFNNMLNVIIGCVDLIRNRLPKENSASKYLDEIEKAAHHSSDVTGQLLAFSRQQVVEPRILDLNQKIEEITKTLGRLLGEDIQLEFQYEPELWKIKADPTRLDQVLINLAVNARDAMPDGGKLTIETANVVFSEDDARSYPGIEPGQFIQLVVSDDGLGMDKKTLTHIFEPFFTTKALGKGTGLGLATVYGIVSQAGGFINVYSELGKGTIFKVYFPRELAAALETECRSPEAIASGSGRVLVVEDEDLVREITRNVLEDIGYQVEAVKLPSEAIALCQSGIPVDLLLTDVVLPEMNGVQLASRLRETRPGLPVLYMSGYTSNVVVNQGILKEGVDLVQKPFSSAILARKVRDVLSRS